jgi:hypothetical protein
VMPVSLHRSFPDPSNGEHPGEVALNWEKPPRKSTGGRLRSRSPSTEGWRETRELVVSPGRGTSSGLNALLGIVERTASVASSAAVTACSLFLRDNSLSAACCTVPPIGKPGLAGKAINAGDVSRLGMRAPAGEGGPDGGGARMGAPANGDDDLTLDPDVRETRVAMSRFVGEARSGGCRAFIPGPALPLPIISLRASVACLLARYDAG